MLTQQMLLILYIHCSIQTLYMHFGFLGDEFSLCTNESVM